VVTAANAVAIRAVLPAEGAFAELYPLRVGTTWVYATTGGEEGEAFRIRQVTGKSTVHLTLLHQTIVRERFVDAAGERVAPDRVFALGERGDEFLLLEERQATAVQKWEPPLPLYRPPEHTGETWGWQADLRTGLVALERVARMRYFGTEPVPVAGGGLRDCPHYERVMEGLGEPHFHDEWLCPDIGPVLLRERIGETVTESTLVAFRSTDVSIGAVPFPGLPESSADPADAAVQSSRYAPDAEPDLQGATRSEWLIHGPDFPPVAASGFVVVAGSRGVIHARNSVTGEVVWRFDLVSGIVAPPAISDRVVVLLDIDRTLWALDLATGIARWAVRLPDVTAAPFAASGDTVLVPLQDGTVRALNTDDGSERWSAPLFADFQPVVAGDRVILADTPETLRAVELSTGESVWTTAVPGITTPLSASEEVVIGIHDTVLYAVDVDDGSLRWSVEPEMAPDEKLWTRAAVTPTSAIVHGGLGTVAALSLSTGAMLWRVSAGPSGPPPLVLGSQVIVGQGTGGVRAFSVTDGRGSGSWTPAIPRGSRVIALAYADGELLVTVAGENPWPSAMFAFATAASPPPVRQLDIGGEVRPSPVYAQFPPVITDEGVLIAGFDDRGSSLWMVPSAGPPTRLATDAAEIPFAITAGDVVITQLGSDVVGIPPAGGAPAWRVPVGKPIFPADADTGLGVPALAPDGDTVFVPTAEGSLVAVDPRSGQTLWGDPMAPADDPFAEDPFGKLGVALALPDGDVVFGGDPIVRLDGGTGEERWSVPGIEPAIAMAFGEGVVVASGQVTTAKTPTWAVTGIDAATGRERWRLEADASFQALTAYADLVVIVRNDGTVQALEVLTGAERWSFEPPTSFGEPVVVVGDLLAVASGHSFGELAPQYQVALLDAVTGRFVASMQAYSGDAAPVGAGDGTLVIAAGDSLYLLRPTER
jgi:outer membrane protein assembly factor BamB